MSGESRREATAMSDAIPRELLHLAVPEGVPTETGFFEISGTASCEAVNSRVYAWFLDREENPQLAPLFLDALLRVALAKLGDASATKRVTLEEYECSLEVTTASGKRIDILLDDTEAQSAVIIENKLYSSVHNDLVDYWNHISYSEDQKLGVLLTLHPTRVPDSVKSRFVNVTHLEWIEAVESKGIPVGLSLYTYGLLTDFFNTMRTQSTSKSMNDQARFFFDHPTQVVRAKDCFIQAVGYIYGELNEVAQQLGLSLEYNRRQPFEKGYYCYLKNPKNGDAVFYTICCDGLFSSEHPAIDIIIELQSNAIHHVGLLDRALKDNPASNALRPSSKIIGGYYVHYRAKTFSIELNNIDSFKELITQLIRDEFAPVMSIICEHLDALGENK